MSQTATTTEVAPGILRIDTPLGDRFASIYALVGDDAVALYDTGVDGTIPRWVLPELAAAGIAPERVATVVISHADVDHFGGIADARVAFPHARIVAGAADIPLIENFAEYVRGRGDSFADDFGWHEDPAVLAWCREVTREAAVDAAAIDGEELALGSGRVAVIRAVPGHTVGHLAIHAPWADAVLVADAVLGASVDLADGTPAFPPTYRHVDDYLQTIETLDALTPRLLLTAHYPTFADGEASAFLERSRDFVERLDTLLRVELDRAPEGLTLAELLDRVGPHAGDWPTEGTAGALAFPVVGHLERLARLGRLERRGERDGAPVWVEAAAEGRFR